jgi:phage shock protein A
MAGLWERIKRIFNSNLNALLDGAEDPEKMADQIIRDMNEQLKNTKKHTASAIANLKKLERDYQNEVNKAQNYAQKARVILTDDDPDNDYLAKECLLKKKHHESIASQIKTSLDQQREAVEKLKSNLRKLEAKVRESENKKNLLTAKHATAKMQKNIADQMSGLDSKSNFDAFDRLEKKVNEMEDTALAQLELNTDKIDTQLEEISFDSSVESEFLALKRECGLLEGPSAGAAGASSSAAGSASVDSDVDDEFEKMKADLKK